VGQQWGGIITNSYSVGVVTGAPPVGGLIGGVVANGLTFDSFWDIDTSGLLTSAAGTGKTTAQMQTKSTFESSGWDFTTPVWTIDEGVDYPRLWWEFQNTLPVAVTGPNQTAYAWIDGYAEVTLDGSGSYDDDGDELTYYWSWEIDSNTYDANGVSPTIELPVGEHTIELVVNDGINDSEPNHTTVTVIPPVEASMKRPLRK